MKSLIGITNHDIYFVKSHLADATDKLQVLGFEDSPDPKAKVILVPTVPLLLKHQKFFNKCKSSVYVFDNPVKCSFLPGIKLLDIEKNEPAYRFLYKKLNGKIIKKSMNLKTEGKITKEKIDVIPLLLNQIKSDGMSPILNFLYQCTNSSNRLKYAKAIYQWFASNEETVKLGKQLNKLLGTKKSKEVEKLLEILNSKKYVRLRKAIKCAWKLRKESKSVSYPEISNKYKVESYDIKFIVSNLERYNKLQETTTTTKELFDTMKKKIGRKMDLTVLVTEFRSLIRTCKSTNFLEKKVLEKLEGLNKQDLAVVKNKIEKTKITTKQQTDLLRIVEKKMESNNAN